MENTIKQLIKQLRISSPEERKGVALVLGKIASDEAVIELKRMVEGKWRKFCKRYSFEDQLIGIEVLGETKREDVLEYLKHIYTPIISRKKIGSFFPGDDGLSDTTEDNLEVHHYRNAPKLLIVSLSYSYPISTRTTFNSYTTDINKILWTYTKESEIQRYKENVIKNDTHQAFRKAIGKLEGEIQISI